MNPERKNGLDMSNTTRTLAFAVLTAAAVGAAPLASSSAYAETTPPQNVTKRVIDETTAAGAEKLAGLYELRHFYRTSAAEKLAKANKSGDQLCAEVEGSTPEGCQRPDVKAYFERYSENMANTGTEDFGEYLKTDALAGLTEAALFPVTPADLDNPDFQRGAFSIDEGLLGSTVCSGACGTEFGNRVDPSEYPVGFIFNGRLENVSPVALYEFQQANDPAKMKK